MTPTLHQSDTDASVVASGQLGLLTWAQARRAGLSPRQIDDRVRSGRWIRIHPGVFAVAGTPGTWERSVLAATLRCGTDTVASHMTAAVLQELRGAFRTRVELTKLGTTPRDLKRVTVHRTLIGTADRSRIGGVPATSVARTLADCSSVWSLGQLARALDDALMRNIVTIGAVADVAARLGPAPGRRIGRLRLLVRERGVEVDRADSPPEGRIFRLLVRAGLPEPVQQHPVVVDGHTYELDLSYPEQMLAIEYFGFDAHRTRTAFDHDHQRNRRLAAAGWTVLVFTSADSDTEIVEAIRRFVG